VAFSPDGRRLVSVSTPMTRVRLAPPEREVTIWDTYETRPEAEAAFQEGQKVDRQLREAEQATVARLAGQSSQPNWAVAKWLQVDLQEWLNSERSRGDQRRAAIDRARSHARQGQWQEAAAAYAEASRAGPGAALLHQYEQAAALLLAGDHDGYHRAWAETLAKFVKTTDPWVSQWVARPGLLGTNPDADRVQFVRLAEQAVAAHPTNGPWLQTLGAAHYRAGQWDRALARLQESEKADWGGSPTVVNWLLLAQVHHRLDHAEEARRWLDKAAAWLDRATQPTPAEQAAFLKLDLPDLMACRLLRREAQLLLAGKADDPATVQNETAWFLATAADPKLRDPARAVKLAKKAVERAPREGVYWKTLGVAQYRAGDWKAAVAALDRAEALGAGDGAAKLFLAMAHWQSGEREQARQWYDAAVGWQANAKLKNEDFERFRREAICLLDQVRFLRSFRGHPLGVHWVAYAPDGGRVLSGSFDGTVRLWDVETGIELRRFEGHTGWVTSVAFAPDGKRALSGGYDKTLRLWDTESGKEVRRFEGHTQPVEAVAFAPDGKRALSAAQDKTVRLWDTETGKELGRFEGHTEFARCVAFAPDGKRAVSGSFDQTLRLWDVESGKELRQFTGHAGWVINTAFAPDGLRVLSCGSDKTIRLWDVETGKELRRFEGHTMGVETVAVSPDGRRALSGGDDATARLWDVETGAELHRFEEHQGAVWGVAFSPDGRRALLGSPDTTLQLWELPPPADRARDAGGK
jgi:tetratricopeptide (TPR) repeat protein